MMETGSYAWVYGALLDTTLVNGQLVHYSTANYKIDGSPGEPLPKRTAHQCAYLVSHHSRFSKTLGGFGEDHLLPDIKYGRRDSQD